MRNSGETHQLNRDFLRDKRWPFLGGPENAFRLLIAFALAFGSTLFSFPREISSEHPWVFWPDIYCVYVTASDVKPPSAHCGTLYGRHSEVDNGQKREFVGTHEIRALYPGRIDLSVLKIPAHPRFIAGRYATYFGIAVFLFAWVFAAIGFFKAKKN